MLPVVTSISPVIEMCTLSNFNVRNCKKCFFLQCRWQISSFQVSGEAGLWVTLWIQPQGLFSSFPLKLQLVHLSENYQYKNEKKILENAAQKYFPEVQNVKRPIHTERQLRKDFTQLPQLLGFVWTQGQKNQHTMEKGGLLMVWQRPNITKVTTGTHSRMGHPWHGTPPHTIHMCIDICVHSLPTEVANAEWEAVQSSQKHPQDSSNSLAGTSL